MKSARWAVAVASFAVLSGCATAPGPQGPGQKRDPWENWNRKVFAFNEGLDEHVLKPTATAYQKVVPSFMRTAVTNVFNNFSDAWSAVNLLLQGRLQDGVHQTMRFATNSVLGLGGVLDIATEAGIERRREDFGQTLGRWGVGPGYYVVLPVLGPSTVRDTAALPLDRYAAPASVVSDDGAQVGLTVLQIVNTRASLLGAGRVIDDIALDKYGFIRDAYFARRRSLVYDDGDPPSEDDVDEEAPQEGAAAPAAAPASGPASAPAGAASGPSK